MIVIIKCLLTLQCIHKEQDLSLAREIIAVQPFHLIVYLCRETHSGQEPSHDRQVIEVFVYLRIYPAPLAVTKFYHGYVKFKILCIHCAADKYHLCAIFIIYFSEKYGSTAVHIARRCNSPQICHDIVFYIYLVISRGISHLSYILGQLIFHPVA